ncbi:MAG TPA: response regulator transcription factor [Gaiellaceae bacterium]|nr:response regulator transcription factor [Gaiellaceae bacterium]
MDASAASEFVASVLVADDHPHLRAAVRSVLERERFLVCAEAGDAASAIDAAMRYEPDICLLDIKMPGSGIAATAGIAAMVPSTTIVMLTVSRSDADLFRAIQAGAAGYLLKGGDLRQLPSLLQRALQGEALLTGDLVARVLDEFRQRGRRRRRLGRQPEGEKLTNREVEVLELLADDFSTAEIAQRLAIQEVTVRTHIARVLKKLRVPNRQAALRLLRS